MDSSEYLVHYGAEGFLGRFSAPPGVRCQRGDRVMVKSHRGLELGTVRCEATPGHAHFLPDRLRGEIIRLVLEEEVLLTDRSIFDEACRLAEESQLPITVVDVEVILEPRTIVVHYLRHGSGSLRPLVKELSKQFHALVELQDLNLGIATEYGDSEYERYCNSSRKVAGSCGSGGCGNGGCGNGGCGNGGCGSVTQRVAASLDSYLVELRSKIPGATPAFGR